jgi:hypothetical protein
MREDAGAITVELKDGAERVRSLEIFGAGAMIPASSFGA